MTEDRSKKVFAELWKLSGREIARTWDEFRDDLRQRIAMTRDELRAEYDEKLARSRDEVRTELRGEIATMGDQLRAEMRQLGVVTEGLRSDVQMVAEGLAMLSERVDANQREMIAGFAALRTELTSLLRSSYGDLDRRVTRLEETVQV